MYLLRLLPWDWKPGKVRDDDVNRLRSNVQHIHSMTKGVLSERFAKVAKPDWKEISFKGNAGVVWDTGNDKDAELTVMIVGHADKIRMQVRSIDPTGKIFVNSDSFLPQTLIGKFLEESPLAKQRWFSHSFLDYLSQLIPQ